MTHCSTYDHNRFPNTQKHLTVFCFKQNNKRKSMPDEAGSHSLGDIKSIILQFVYFSLFAVLLVLTITLTITFFHVYNDTETTFIRFFLNYLVIIFKPTGNIFSDSILQSLPIMLIAIDRLLSAKKISLYFVISIFAIQTISIALSYYLLNFINTNEILLTQRLKIDVTCMNNFKNFLDFSFHQNFINVLFFAGLQIPTQPGETK